MNQSIACPEHGLLCAYTGREPDRCPWCHTRWDVVLARRSHSCESPKVWSGQTKKRRVARAVLMRRSAAQEAAGGRQGRSQPSPQVRTPGAAR